jgi:hypothetical protein
MVYVVQQQLDSYDAAVRHAIKCKAMFDKQVLERTPGEVIFHKGQLVQFYCSSLDYTFKAKWKLLPKWSPPHHIITRIRNSYKVETLKGNAIAGEIHAQRLCAFIPWEGTRLAKEQRKLEEKLSMQEKENENEEEQSRDLQERGCRTDEGNEEDKDKETDDDKDQEPENREKMREWERENNENENKEEDQEGQG